MSQYHFGASALAFSRDRYLASDRVRGGGGFVPPNGDDMPAPPRLGYERESLRRGFELEPRGRGFEPELRRRGFDPIEPRRGYAPAPPRFTEEFGRSRELEYRRDDFRRDDHRHDEPTRSRRSEYVRDAPATRRAPSAATGARELYRFDGTPDSYVARSGAPRPLSDSYVARSGAPRPLSETGAIEGSRLVKPLEGTSRVTSTFGEKTALRGHRAHGGVDLAKATGAPIKAMAAGRVVQVETPVRGADGGTGFGNFVVLDHGNGYFSRYAHTSANLVREGDTVEAGEVIAKVGSTGTSTGSHLHFEVLKGGLAAKNRVDPMPFLTGRASMPEDRA